jgi:hypothetical protein
VAEYDVLVIGAGMAGLVAARELVASGYSVRVVDKGRGMGGRLATRRSGAATFDHGAQFLLAHEPRFAAALEAWRSAGVLEPWGRADAASGGVRWRGAPSMTAIAKHLACDLDVLLGRRVIALRRTAAGWKADCEDGTAVAAGAVVITAPVPQALELLAASAIDLPAAQGRALGTLGYEPCLAAMVVLDGPSRVPPPGYIAPEHGPLAWIADNHQKGVSAVPALTLHATAAFSRAHWDDPREASGRQLVEAAGPWLGSSVLECVVHGWRYARPLRRAGQPFEVVGSDPPLLMAGDAFGGPDVEGAAVSGWAAARALEQLFAKLRNR